MHAIVTGGAGFIGAHVVERLLAQDHEVTVVDNFSTGRRENLPRHPHLHLIENNVLDCCPGDFPDEVGGIIHLAATPSVTASWDHPIQAHHQNLTATLAVIELCRALGIPRMVLASSAAIYGDQHQLPITEAHRPAPLSPYGLQKLVSEQYGTLFAAENGFSFVGLRLFNVFGPRQLPNSPYSGVVSIFSHALKEGHPVTIFGDGQQSRDFVFVEDVAQAFCQALVVPLQAGESAICNVGKGQSTSLLQLVDALKGISQGWPGELRFAEKRVGDIEHSQADITRARILLGYDPEWSIAAGLQRLLYA